VVEGGGCRYQCCKPPSSLLQVRMPECCRNWVACCSLAFRLQMALSGDGGECWHGASCVLWVAQFKLHLWGLQRPVLCFHVLKCYLSRPHTSHHTSCSHTSHAGAMDHTVQLHELPPADVASAWRASRPRAGGAGGSGMRVHSCRYDLGHPYPMHVTWDLHEGAWST
jgi:hypothetical protein